MDDVGELAAQLSRELEMPLYDAYLLLRRLEIDKAYEAARKYERLREQRNAATRRYRESQRRAPKNNPAKAKPKDVIPEKVDSSRFQVKEQA